MRKPTAQSEWWGVLRHLRLTIFRPVTLREIAKAMRLRPSRVRRWVERLEDEGYVRGMTITEAGLAVAPSVELWSVRIACGSIGERPRMPLVATSRGPFVPGPTPA